ncbi:hypothetical protein NSPZN2_140005 [Nitrospira defluvii]|uniref:Uncharacterized protein n=1 Tax=Nitrospira defluvii TaxID=330214 RepID=A0ABM8R9V3_9BACT|nr:hypothetical protein NSPZN2_140005 [Nitrospira defluvii]
MGVLSKRLIFKKEKSACQRLIS